jgi:hypothetical protein
MRALAVRHPVVMLFDLTDGFLSAVPATTFAAEGVLERAHLQRALRDHIAVLGAGLLVVAEEFGDFQDARRRIDLLCVDREARLVVVELKRTDDGGHMELQALRYAAMVSTMTFERLADTYQAHLATTVSGQAPDARAVLAGWLEAAGGEEAVISRDVRIILASADFGREITTTVLWLNDVYSMDIRCVRLSPYRLGDRLLLDVQPVIPLPEAEELTIQLRQRETAARAATSRRDRTAYIITAQGGDSEPLRKRHAVLAMVGAVSSAGVSCEAISRAIPGSRFMAVEGNLEGDALTAAFIARYPGARNNTMRWFFDQPVHQDDTTWVLSNQWGLDTQETLAALAALSPASGIGYRAATPQATLPE